MSHKNKGDDSPPIAVLYIDDEPVLHEPTKITLEKRGNFSVDTSLSTRDAREKLRKRSYDVIVSDYQMPEQNGIEFLRQLRESGNLIPFIIFTGKGREDAVIEAYDAGADFYIVKGGNPTAMIRDLSNKITQIVTRRRAEKGLRTNERQLHAIIDGSSIPQFVINHEHKVIYWNKALEKYSGIPASDIRGTPDAWKAFYPEKRPVLADLLVDNNVGGLPSWYQDKFKPARCVEGAFEATDFFPRFGRTGGTWLHFSAVAIKDDEGRIIGALETLEDITDRKNAEEDLKNSEQYLKTIFQSVQTGLIIINPETHTIIDANPAAVRLIGADKEDIIGAACDDFICHTMRGKCPVTDLHQNIENSESLLIKAEGKKIPVLKTVIPVTISGNQYLLESILDITDRKLAEDALQTAYQELEQKVEERTHELSTLTGNLQNEITERNRIMEALAASEEKYRSLVEQIGDIIFHIDPQGVISYISPHVLAAAGLDKNRMPRIDIFELVEPRNRDIVKLFLDPDLAEHKPISGFELPLHNPITDKDALFEVNGMPTYDKTGIYTGYSGIARDITERKNLQNEVATSLKEKEILLKEIHHRVKNNMQVISSLLNLQAKLMKDVKSREAIRESQTRVMSIALVHEKLYQSKSFAEIDYHDYLKKIAENLLQTYGIPPGKVRIDIHADTVVLPISKAIPISLMINEMLSNSLKYAFPGERTGIITVNLRKNGDRYSLVVRDNGIGLPDEIDLDNIETLGLQLVTSLVAQILGTITLNRSGGTEFRIDFTLEPIGGDHYD